MTAVLKEPSAAERAAAVLLTADRCDRCRAPAQVRVELPSGRLDFCKHHYDSHADALTAAGAQVLIDQRPSLLTL